MYVILYLIFGGLSESDFEHAIYLSTINVTIDEHAIITDIKVFEDDLRDVIRADVGMPVDTASSKFRVMVSAYFDKHVKINANDELVKFSPVSFKRIGESYHFRMRSDLNRPISHVTFDIDYFLEIFPVQQNVLHLKSGDKQWYHIFKKGKQQFSLNINL